MYKLLLILKYLRKRRIAWWALGAVTLCTTMVLVVISVMGGWLQMFRHSYHGLKGDVIVSTRSLSGFEHYEDMLVDIRKIPGVRGAMPVVNTFGLVNIDNQIRQGVQIVGLDLKQAEKINDFASGIRLQPDELERMAAENDRLAAAAQARLDAKVKAGGDANRDAGYELMQIEQAREQAASLRAKKNSFPSFDKPFPDQFYRDHMMQSKIDVSKWPGMIVGYNVIGLKRDKGLIEPNNAEYSAWVRLTPLITTSDVGLDASNTTVQPFWIVDDSRTGVYLQDTSTVYVQFDVLQKLLKMDAQSYESASTHEQMTTSARTNEIQISVEPGVDPMSILKPVEQIVDQTDDRFHIVTGELNHIKVETWDMLEADYLNAVEKEKSLLVFLFGIMCVVAIFLIFCIFYMIVAEKTRDIGILKAIGADSRGVAMIFIGYGFVIGVLGGGLGFLSGFLIVHNINEIHAWMGRRLHIQVWNAKTYLFDRIPNTISPTDATWIVGLAIFSSVIGAVLPAIRAARLRPVDSLRWE